MKILIQKRPDLITVALSNIFTMRLIGNKTHGDLAEIGIMEFVNQFMDVFRSAHVDCVKGMKQIPAGSVDLVITDCCRYLYQSGTSNIKTL